MKLIRTKLPKFLAFWGSPFRLELTKRVFEAIDINSDVRIGETSIYYPEKEREVIKYIINDIKRSVKK